ncbi:MAG: DNA topoisomerase III [Verrucomicrobiota bacterium]
MSKSLIIAEKPSVATDLSRVLAKAPGVGKFEKKKEFFESDSAIISSAVGHLVELKMPTRPDGKNLGWGFQNLPILPDRFELQPIEKSQDRLKLLLKLMRRKDVTEVINACDAGREGELIFRYILMIGAVEKPTRRLWMQSMTNDAILSAWGQLREEPQMRSLADAALCRSESDWLVGLNGTRALTAFNSRHGGFNLTPAGRVQTPTLSILSERERIIRNFVSRDFYEVHGTFQVAAGEYSGRWFREDFRKSEDDDQLRAERIWSLQEAEAIQARCQGKPGQIEEKKKPSKQSCPALYDLTTLQREAGSRYGFSAQRTLQLAQSLYERHKVLTYPRTDSRYLPSDYIGTVRGTLKGFASASGSKNFSEDYSHFAGELLSQDYLKPIKRVFNTAKVSDHFAIIPTGKLPAAAIDEPAMKIYDMVMRRFLAVFYPPAEFENTTRLTRIGQDAFKTDGKILVVPGWLEVYGRKPGVAGGGNELAAAQPGEEAETLELELLSKQTQPPARYTEPTLLSAMETAGKRVDDEELRDAMSERGLGTPATRAATIEGLIRQKYIAREARDLHVTNKGLALIDTIDALQIDILASPEMTGEWEMKLKQMERGQVSRQAFMQEIRELTETIVTHAKKQTDELKKRVFPDLEVACPVCGNGPIKQTDSTYECYSPECKFRIKKYVANHEITLAEAKQLLETKFAGPFDDFKSRFGKDFSAGLELDEKFKVGFVFESDGREDELDNLKEEQILTRVTAEGYQNEPVYETERAYLAPRLGLQGDEKGIRVSKQILKRDIPSDQAVKLFRDGKTDLLPGFVSKRGRKFSAYLLLDRSTGKVSFEFAAPKKKSAKKRAAKKS